MMERGMLLLPHLQTFLEQHHSPGATMILVLVSLVVTRVRLKAEYI